MALLLVAALGGFVIAYFPPIPIDPKRRNHRTSLLCCVITLFASFGCSSTSAPAYDPLSLITSSLADGIVETPYSQVLSANGGDGNYTWMVASGSLPEGISLTSNTGVLSGSPPSPGTSDFSIRVSSGDGQSLTRQTSITIYLPLNISTKALDHGLVGTAYTQTLAASGGDGSYSWEVVEGTLPEGLNLASSTGILSGTPTSADTADFKVRVTSGDGQIASQELSIEVIRVVRVTTVALQDGVIGTPYSQTLSATGGDGSYIWEVRDGSLPDGLNLAAATGEISGTPSSSGTNDFWVQVTSGDGQTATQVLSITIYTSLNIMTADLADGFMGVPYSQTLSANGGDGDYFWGVTEGSLPEGISLSSAKSEISGTPSSVGTNSFTVEVKSGDGQKATQDFSITIGNVTEIGGIIQSSTTWDVDSSPYRLTSDVQLAHGATLRIKRGVVVFGDGLAIQVWGVLDVDGSANDPVQLNELHIQPRGSTEELFSINIDFTEMNGGSVYAPSGLGVYGSLTLRNSTISNLGRYLYLWYPEKDCYIERNVFRNSGGISIGTSGSVRVYVRNNTFLRQTTDYAVKTWATYGPSETVLEYNSFLSTDRIAVTVRVDGSLSATKNYWGTTETEQIEAMIFDKNDDLHLPAYIDYLPILTEPHPDTPEVGGG